MFSESPFSGACVYATYEVVVMLLGTLLLGVLLGFLIWGWAGRHVARMKSHIRMLRHMQSLEQSRNASLTLRLNTLREASGKEKSQRSYAEYRMRIADEEIAILTSRIESLISKVEDQHVISEPVMPHSDDETTYTFTSEITSLSEEPTLADITHAMQTPTGETQRDAAHESHDDAHRIANGTQPESLLIAEKIFGRRVLADDLTLIEGVGKKMDGILRRGGVDSWQSLAQCRLPYLRQLISEAGPRYREYDPITWPVQARMAARGEWRKLKAYQDTLANKE